MPLTSLQDTGGGRDEKKSIICQTIIKYPATRIQRIKRMICLDGIG